MWKDHFEMELAEREAIFNMDMNHFHPTYEIYYLYAGKRQYFIQNRLYQLQANDLVFINKYELHKTMVCEDPYHLRLLINFGDPFLHASSYSDPEKEQIWLPFQSHSRIFRPNPEQAPFIKQLLEQMYQEYQNPQPGSGIYLKALLLQLLLYTGRHMEHTEPARISESSPLDNKIFEVIDYINLNYRSSLSLTSIAKQFYVSESYLSRTFRRKTGFSFIEYIHTLRVRDAQQLLASTPDKVVTICQTVGFESLSQFGRVFRAITGKTPKQFRQGE